MYWAKSQQTETYNPSLLKDEDDILQLHIHVCIYIYIYICMCRYLYMYWATSQHTETCNPSLLKEEDDILQVHIRICIHIYVYVCVDIQICTRQRANRRKLITPLCSEMRMAFRRCTHIYVYTYGCICICRYLYIYSVGTISRLLEIICLFCRIYSVL